MSVEDAAANGFAARMTLTIFPSNTVARPTTPTTDTPTVSEMTPFVEIPVDTSGAARLRAALETEPAEFFRANFGGRLPSPQEREAFIAETERRIRPLRTFKNSLYVVHSAYTPPFTPDFIHLVIRRHDGAPCVSWRHFQQIKNELVGTECEAVELFPAESRLVDTANDYHLWVYADPASRFPIGWSHRIVGNEAPAPVSRLVASLCSSDSSAASLAAPGIRISLGA